ncbi:arsenite efflux transporter metallochaperone ArsD [uncultured Thiodictyon sp.]|uniref:arsenite efflux transporter metallochaperone ArsD n=1 Tax=uncultured Thiodictyon sp. TaxID=1846217 RepID=UPI0025D8F631|nr:arsenite efflux transporter metallochaperone ArsD [uncultured Thiodictyon sp.]
MKKLEIYDPAMCCSTGICGVEVDPVLVAFNADLQWLAGQGVEVSRYNLSQEPQAFAANPAVLKEIDAGMERLPLTLVDGQVVATGAYLSRAQLVQKLGLAPVPIQAADPFPVQVSTACCKPGGGCC